MQLFGSELTSYDMFSLSGGALYTDGFDIGNVRVPMIRIITILAAFVMMILLWLLVTRTRVGKAMRATSFDREAAAMMGIDIDKVIVFAFVLGSALAGAAGVLFALRIPTYATIGFLIENKGFTAAVIGGIGSIPGAMAGGPCSDLRSHMRRATSRRAGRPPVFILLILFLVFRPQAFSAKRTSERCDMAAATTTS
jgi:branched-chain amino acid transport system permease protein